MKIRLIAKGYDFWIGWFGDSKRRRLYVLPMPCVGVCLDFDAAQQKSEVQP